MRLLKKGKKLIKNNKTKKIILIGLLMTFLSGCILFATPKNSHDKYSVNTAFAEGGGLNDVWTLYARLLMENEEVQEENENSDSGIVDSTISSLIGSGGVTADIPYTKILSDGAKLDGEATSLGSEASRTLASTLATYSYYSYFETISGNKFATGFSSFISSIGRFLGSAVGQLSMSINDLVMWISDQVASFFLTFNIFHLLGFTGGSQGVDQNSKFAKVIIDFLNAFGLNNTFFKTITGLTLLIFCGVFGFQAMRSLGKDGFKGSGVTQAFKKWLLRFTVLFVAFPVMGALTGGIISQLRQAQNDGHLENSVVDSYLLNVRYWASTQNLAPNGVGNSGSLPNVRNTKDGFVDTRFDPFKKRDTIKEINRISYNRMGGNLDGDKSRALLSNWANNDSFNINTYASDVRSMDIYKTTVWSNVLGNNSGIDGGDLPSYIWSANPNVSDEKTRLPSADNIAKAKEIYGVANNTSFSTQSVALMLQTAFDNTGGNFYAYNVPPTGAQQTIKNVTSVKTEWKSVSLVGEGMFGKFASYLAMLVTLLVQTFLYIACLVSLFSANLLESFKRLFLRVYQVMVFASPSASAGVFALQLGVIGTTVFFLFLPTILLSLVSGLSQALYTIPALADFSSSWLSIIVSGGTIFLAYALSFIEIKTYKQTAIKMMMTMPLELALNLDDKAKRYLGRKDPFTVADSITSSLNKNQGAKNRYYDGESSGNNPVGQGKQSTGNDGNSNAKSFIKGAVTGQAVSKLLNRGNGNSETSNENLDKKLINGGFGVNSDGQLINEQGQLINEQGRLINEDGLLIDEQGNYIDEQGRLINSDGQLVDTDGNVIPNGSYGMDSDNNLINEDGFLVDEQGQLLDPDGNIIYEDGIGYNNLGELVNEQGQLVDEQGRLINANNELVDSDGNIVDDYGRLINEDGQLINSKGELVSEDSQGIGFTADGQSIDQHGRLVDEQGKLVDSRGNLLNKGDYGYDVNGNRIDDYGRLISEDGQLLDNKGYELDKNASYGYNLSGEKVDNYGKLIEEPKISNIADFRNEVKQSPQAVQTAFESEKAQQLLIDKGFSKKNSDGEIIADVERATNVYNSSRRPDAMSSVKYQAEELQEAFNVGTKDMYDTANKTVKQQRVEAFKDNSVRATKKVVTGTTNTVKSVGRGAEKFVKLNSDIPVDKIKATTKEVAHKTTNTVKAVTKAPQKLTQKKENKVKVNPSQIRADVIRETKAVDVPTKKVNRPDTKTISKAVNQKESKVFKPERKNKKTVSEVMNKKKKKQIKKKR